MVTIKLTTLDLILLLSSFKPFGKFNRINPFACKINPSKILKDAQIPLYQKYF